MENENSEQNLIRVKVDQTGVDLSVGRSLPDALARLMPAKYRLRRSVDEAITGRLLQKIRSNEEFDEAEVSFAENVLSDSAQKYLRLKRVERRAYSLFQESQPPLLLEAGTDSAASESCSAEAPAETSDDWVNKFREDASLVDDELVREIYARVLSEEARHPTTFSLRTLAVLRYLDREAATAFGSLQKVVINGYLVPQQSVEQNNILDAVGLNHTTMLVLEDAGLVNSSTNSSQKQEGRTLFFGCSGHGRIVMACGGDTPITVRLNVHLLTPAGKQLSRIAECEPDELAFEALLDWLRRYLPVQTDLYVAKAPSRNWKGTADELDWEPVSATKVGRESASAAASGDPPA